VIRLEDLQDYTKW